MSEKDSAVKFDYGKPKARYFYWDAFALLYDDYEIQVGQKHMDTLIKNLFHERDYSMALQKLRAIEDEINASFDESGRHNIGLGVAQASEEGAKHYGHFNYQKGFKWSQPLDALGRHMLKYLKGQKRDIESQLDHRHHMIANIYMLAYHIEKNIGVNDLLVESTEGESDENG